jgi:DNA replication protein DnaC
MCIKLDSKSELYLTNDCIVTHNTSWAIKMLQEYFNQVWYGNRYRCRGLFIFVPGFLNDIKKNINNPSREFNDLVSRISKADLVVWDDIGANKLSEFDHTQLLSYIDQRNLDLKSNIYTGNLDYNELQEALGNRLLSRVWNNSIRVKLLGEDRRGLDGDPSDS